MEERHTFVSNSHNLAVRNDLSLGRGDCEVRSLESLNSESEAKEGLLEGDGLIHPEIGSDSLEGFVFLDTNFDDKISRIGSWQLVTLPI